jgi:L-amino acid N-acyltransferase YncA
VWTFLQATFRAGDSYTFDEHSTEADMRAIWTEHATASCVACDSAGQVIGIYCLKPNHVGRGRHVCNASYVVAPEARGQGVARLLCEHSQATALALGFRAMQFNIVVSTNAVAVHLWQRLGFDIVGRLPGAFDHRELGFVDALVMFKTLR